MYFQGEVITNDVNGNPETSPKLAADNEPWTTLAYYNGPGGIRNGGLQANMLAESNNTTLQNPCNSNNSSTTTNDNTGKAEEGHSHVHATTGKEYIQQTNVPLESETHGGQDVIAWANGKCF